MEVTLKGPKEKWLPRYFQEETMVHKYARRFLQKRNCQIYHAEGDTDVHVVTTAVESA